MESADLIKLARLFDKFIELDSSFVMVEDIKAIKKVEPATGEVKYEGIEIITPYGTFHDSSDFNTLKTRIKDAMEVLKATDMAKPVGKSIPSPTSGVREHVLLPEQSSLDQSKRKIVPVEDTEPKVKTITIGVGEQGAEGTLFEDPNLYIVEREKIAITTPSDELIGTVETGGMVRGENVSGVILEGGKYKLAFMNYPHKSAKIMFKVAPRRKAAP